MTYNHFRITSFADPCLLSPLVSYLSENKGRGGQVQVAATFSLERVVCAPDAIAEAAAFDFPSASI